MLQTINNQPLPFVIEQGVDYLYELIDVELTLSGNGSFTDATTYRETDFSSFSADSSRHRRAPT